MSESSTYETAATDAASAEGVGEEEQAREGDRAASERDGESGPVDAVPLSIVFDILKNERRRLTLRYPEENGGTANINDLATYIASEENDKDPAELSSKERKRVYVGLYQWHLEKMADVDVIETDRNLEARLGQNAPQVLKYLDDGDETRWEKYYAGGVATGSALVVLAHAAGLATVQVLAVGLLTTGAVGGLALAHERRERA